MTRLTALITLALLLAGCGLAETASTAATVAELEAQQAKAALEAKDKIVEGINNAQQVADDQRKAAEEAATAAE